MERTICKFKALGILVITLISSACNQCDLDCENGGECTNLGCDCPEAYFGELCEFTVEDEFLGEFDVTNEDCSISNSNQAYAISIQKNMDTFLIQNFSNFGIQVVGVLEADSIRIPEQILPDYQVSGSIKFIQPGQLSVQSYILSGSKTDSCSYFATN